MWRAIGKTCVACAYTWTGAGRLLAKRRSGGRPDFITCYHRVVRNFDAAAVNTIPSMLISAKMFERHLDWIGKRFDFVSLDEIGGRLPASRRRERPAAAVTFDDGYADVYHNAYPILKRKGIPAAVFVVTGLIGSNRLQIFDRLYVSLRHLQSRGKPLMRTVLEAVRSTGTQPPSVQPAGREEPFTVMTALLNVVPQGQLEEAALKLGPDIGGEAVQEMAPLTWEMIERMHHDGFTIGSHTKSHSLLTSEAPSTVQQEMVESKEALEARLKGPIRHFAYPDGRFDATVVRAVNRAGYSYAYTICPWRQPEFPLLTIPRKVLWERSCVNAFGRFSSAVMNCHTLRAFDAGSCSGHNHSLRREMLSDATVS